MRDLAVSAVFCPLLLHLQKVVTGTSVQRNLLA
jgi:hypothetical protein